MLAVFLVFLDWNLKTILSYLKSAPSNWSNCKTLRKNKKCLNLGPKKPYLDIFGLEFKKNIVIFEISTLKFVKNESLTHTVNLGLGSVFSKGPMSAFFEGPGLGPGPLYKVCLLEDPM